MQEKTNLQNLFNFKVVAVIMAMIMVISYLSFSGTTNVVKVNGNDTGNAPFIQNGHTYVPLNEIAQKMGDKVTSVSSQKKVVIQQKNGTTISVTSNQARAIWNGKIVPLKTKQVNKVNVPVNAKAIYKNGQVYVPLEIISDSKGLAYPVKVVNEGGKTVIYVGTIPAPAKAEPKPSVPTKPTPSQQPKPELKPELKPEPKPEPKPSQPAKPAKPAPTQPTPTQPSNGEWVAPVLKSAWSADPAVNYRTLQNELGFKNGGSRYALPEYPQGVIHVVEQGGKNVDITFFGWEDTSVLPNSYRVPIVAKELFKLYFGGDANRVWNYFNSNDIPDQFISNGFNVNATYSSSTGSITLMLRK